MTVNIQKQPIQQSTLVDSGLAIHVPSFDGMETLELRFREQGRRLYTPRDTSMADSMLSLTRRVAARWEERDASVRTERQRIMRDLHDDVAARLLTLVHRVKDPSLAVQARDALNALRQTIYELDEQKPLALGDLLMEMQSTLRERARAYNIDIDWQEPTLSPMIEIGSRTQINLQRTLIEAVSNAIAHCAPTHFIVKLRFDNQLLRIIFCNNGNIRPMEEWVYGKGINNINSRMGELGGKAEWTITPAKKTNESHQICCLELAVPLPQLSGTKT